MTMRIFGMLMLSIAIWALEGCTDVTVINVVPTSGPANTPGPTTPPPPATNTSAPRSPTPTTPPVEPTSTPTGPTPTMGEATDTPTPSPTPSPTSTPMEGPPIGEFTCTMDAAKSTIILNGINNVTFPPIQVGGSFVTECGGINPDTGNAACTAKNLQLDAVSVFGIGFICATYVGGCADGQIACDGGTPLDTALRQDHNIGSCDGNASCTSLCEAYCQALTPPRSVFSSGCAGFCSGGQNDNNPCTLDSGCPGGSCNGGDPVNPPNICGCQCLLVGGNASRPGGFLANFGVQINVEGSLPCDGTDVTIALPPVCIPLVSESSTGLLVNAPPNPPGYQIGPKTGMGEPVSCEQLETGSPSGLAVVSNISFFDSALGDLEAAIDFTCQ